ncbi:MAG: flagellar filament capping protein FliD [Spirochaetales bacterium]|nr:flagellar filament capping protein FliD [Spirochaetales bacterium]
MADGVSIPGVSDKYKTNDLVESLMEVERVPLKRKQTQLETYQKQQDAWRNVNQKMSSLRESTKSLYSFENPFNSKLSSSTDEFSLTADAGREAEFGSFKMDVIKCASTDRFLSDNIDKDFQVKAGLYTFEVGDKSVNFNWKGGKLNDFVTALNKRGNGIVKASLIGVSANKKSLLIESLKTGEENSLVFKNDSFEFAKSIGIITEVKSETTEFKASLSSLKSVTTVDEKTQQNLPELSKNNVEIKGNEITVSPRGGFEIEIPSETRKNPSEKIELWFDKQDTADITSEINFRSASPVLPEPGKIEFGGIVISNNDVNTTLGNLPVTKAEPVSPVESDSFFYIKTKNNEEILIPDSYFTDVDEGENKGKTRLSFSMKDFPDAQSIIVRNSNTGKTLTLSVPHSYDPQKSKGFVPKHAISTAGNAVFKYEGITMERSENDIEDVVPHVTLHLHDKSEKTVTIKIEPDTESAKDALITFVGKYNQTIAEMTILSTNKPEVVSELDYLTSEEQETEMERLGMFQGDFSLTNGKTSLQRIISANYNYGNEDAITLLSQIGISTNASSGNQGYSPSKLRGYLEVDEKKLDEALASNLNQIKNLFGYDSDGDLIIDDGIAFKMDKQLTSWVQSGGIISSKTSALESNIKSTNTEITRLETQLERKEAELKSKYAAMEGSLNRLESQSSTLNNFSNSNSRK